MYIGEKRQTEESIIGGAVGGDDDFVGDGREARDHTLDERLAEKRHQRFILSHAA